MKLIFLVIEKGTSELVLLERIPPKIGLSLVKMTWWEKDKEWRPPVPIGQLRPDGRKTPGSLLAVYDAEKFEHLEQMVKDISKVTSSS